MTCFPQSLSSQQSASRPISSPSGTVLAKLPGLRVFCHASGSVRFRQQRKSMQRNSSGVTGQVLSQPNLSHVSNHEHQHRNVGPYDSTGCTARAAAHGRSGSMRVASAAGRRAAAVLFAQRLLDLICQRMKKPTRDRVGLTGLQSVF